MIFTISTLGNNGRLGNQILQYLAGRAIARHYKAELQIPKDWLGRQIFDITDPEIVENAQTQTPVDYIPTPNDVGIFNSIDLFGYWQFQSIVNWYSLKDIKEWLSFKPEVWDVLGKRRKQLNLRYNPYIAVHKRRGDYINKVSDKYCIVSDRSFQKRIDLIKSEHPDIYVLELTEENPSPKIDSVPSEVIDFMLLVDAPYIVRSNSTFSMVAGWLGQTINPRISIHSPLVEDRVGWQDVEFVEGNWPRCADSKNHPGSKLTDLILKD
jgi:hypothetical protein